MTCLSSIIIDKEALINEIGEDNIWKHYIPEIRNIPCTIKSPLRDENKPSFFMYRHSNGHIYYIDRATGERGGLIDFIMSKYGASTINDALLIIYNDFNLNIQSVAKEKRKNDKIQTKKKTFHIEVVKRDWNLYDYDYWDSYGCIKNNSFKFLEQMGVVPIKEVNMVYDNYVKTIIPNTMSYAYECNTINGIKRKIYTPYSSNYKWLSNLPKGYIDFEDIALNVARRRKVLIITSSRKDCLCLINNLGIMAISPSSETVKIDSSLVEKLKLKYDNILVMFDNDADKDINTGVINGKKLATEHGLTYIEIPKEWGAKDPSDLYLKTKNKSEFIKKLKQLINDRLLW